MRAPGDAMRPAWIALAPALFLAVPSSAAAPARTGLDTAQIERLTGAKHMTGEQPRVLFLHYWGVGRAQDLARGLRAALEKTGARLGAM